jgi:hypothetical protein
VKPEPSRLPRQSPWANLITVWFSPDRTFTGLRTDWPWLPAYLATAFSLLVAQFLLSPRTQEVTNALLGTMDADSSAVTLTTWVLRINMVAGPLLQPLTRAFLVSLVVSFTSMFAGVAHRFGKVFAICMWAFLPATALSSLIKGSLLATLPGLPPDQVRFDLLFLVPVESGSLGQAVAGVLDLFFLWTLVLLGYGFVVVHKCKSKVGYTIGCSVALAFAGLSLLW